MSAKELIKPPTTYKADGYDEIEYLKAEGTWDARDGKVRKAKHTLQVLLLCSLVTIIVLAAGLVYQSAKSTVVPYVVQVGPQEEVRSIGLAKEQTYEPQEAEIKYFLERFIIDSRTLPLDPVVAKTQWNRAAVFLRQSAKIKMSDELFKKDNMLDRIGMETSQISPKSILQQTPNSYQARWTEEIYGKDGTVKQKYNMAGTFTIEISPPTNEQEVRQNPLGLYITNFSWTREI